ncbi:protein kinase [Anaeramoeba flamelloides]|uniref:Protein kinase n=1 Tax=Anaeramoeba flamelloides TaxID=1746091 RepID=A0AAV7ZUH2_9EUKA|nr:protein kinase [Anaeramoeba flamelloides]
MVVDDQKNFFLDKGEYSSRYFQKVNLVNKSNAGLVDDKFKPNHFYLKCPQTKRNKEKFLSIVDPLKYSSYFGGSGADYVTSYSIGRESDSYTLVLTGVTTSTDFPVRHGIPIIRFPSRTDTLSFISRFDINGNIIFSTYFGGTVLQNDESLGRNIVPRKTVRDDYGRYWVVGMTTTQDIPITSNSFNRATFNVLEVGYVLCLNQEGNSIKYSSLFGQCDEHFTELRMIKPIITADNTYLLIGGTTNSSHEIYKNSLQNQSKMIESELYAYVGVLQIFRDRTDLLFGTIFGGSAEDYVENAVVFFKSENTLSLWIIGHTFSNDFFDNYDHSVSKNVTIINDQFKGTSSYGFFLQISISNLDDPDLLKPELETASYIGDYYEDCSTWVQLDYSQKYFDKDGYYIGPIAIAGYTYNFDTFSNNSITPDWMKETINDGETQVGFVTLLNPEGTSFDYTLLVGCKDGLTALNYVNFHHYQSGSISGWTSCSKDELPLRFDIWEDINNKDIDQIFEMKFFLMKINLTALEKYPYQLDYDDLIYFSTFVDGVGTDMDLEINYANIKTDFYGNIYSIFTVGEYYQNLYFTDNSYQKFSTGQSSIIIRVYGGYSCNPGSLYDYNMDLCLFCSSGTFSNDTSDGYCKDCPANYYQNKIGETSCIKCPDNETSELGETSCSRYSRPPQLTPVILSQNDNMLEIAWTSDIKKLYYQLSMRQTTGEKKYFLIKNPYVYPFGNGSLYIFDIRGLIGSSRYYIRIRSQDPETNVWSSWSQLLLVSTYGPAFRVRTQEITNQRGIWTINLNWDEPLDYSFSIYKYRIYYKELEGGKLKYTAINSNQTHGTIRNLKTDTYYVTYISSFNCVGESFLSVPKIFRTQSEPPKEVQIKNDVEDVNSITLTWEIPSNQGREITYYEATIIDSDNKLITIEMHNLTKHKFDNLEANAKYNISINAFNAMGKSKNNFQIYQTDPNDSNNKSNLIITIIFSVVGGIAIIGGVSFLTYRKQFNQKNKIRLINKKRKKKTKDFFSNFQESLFGTDETLAFDSYDQSILLPKIKEDIINGNFVNILQNWVIYNKDFRKKLIFCKICTRSEMNIYKQIWEGYKADPRWIPMIQFIGGVGIDKEEIDLFYHKKNFPSIKRDNSQQELQDFSSDFDIQENYIDESESNDDDDDDGSESNDGNDDDSGNDKNNNGGENSSTVTKKQNKMKNLYLVSLEWFPIDLNEYNTFRANNQLPFTEKEILWIIYNLTFSLKVIHQNNIIHRDIKPSNILIGFDGYLRIADFSSAIKIPNGQSTILDKFVGTESFFDPSLQPQLNYSEGVANYSYTFKHDLHALGKTISSLCWNFSPDGDLNVDDNLLKTHLLNNEKKNKMKKERIQKIIIEFINMCLIEHSQRKSLEDIIKVLYPSFVLLK